MTERPEDWNISTLRAFYDERLNENQLRSDERFNQIMEQLSTERENLDKRFDSANRYRETYQAQLNQTLKREEFDARFQVQQEKIDTLSRTNWPLYSSFGGIAVSLVVGLWVIIGLRIDATNQPVVVSLEQARVSNENQNRSIADLRTDFQHAQQAAADIQAGKARDVTTLLQNSEASKTDRASLNERMRIAETGVNASAQADTQSRTDRKQMSDRLVKVEDGLAERRAVEATIKANLIEIETQFCASDIVRNLMHANDLRVMSMIWKKINPGENYPVDNAYYPQVCNRNINPK